MFLVIGIVFYGCLARCCFDDLHENADGLILLFPPGFRRRSIKSARTDERR